MRILALACALLLASMASAQPSQLSARIQPPASLSLRELGAMPSAVAGAATLPDLAKALQSAVKAADGEPALLAPLLTAANQALARPAEAGQGHALAKIKALRDRLAEDKDVAAALHGFYDGVEQAPRGHFVLVNAKGKPELLEQILSHPDFPKNATVFTSEMSLVGPAWNTSLGKKAMRAKIKARAKKIDSIIEPYRRLAREKGLKIWVGHPLWQDGKLYNAYSLVTEKGIETTQRKKFLWKTERWLFSEPEKWEGAFKGFCNLICSEVTAFYSVEGWARPTKIPELRTEAPPLVVASSWWVHNKNILLDSARSIARPLWSKIYRRSGSDKPFTVTKGLRPQGTPVFVVNYTDTAIVTPAPKGSRFHTQVKTRLSKPGWIEVKDGRAKVVAVRPR